MLRGQRGHGRGPGGPGVSDLLFFWDLGFISGFRVWIRWGGYAYTLRALVETKSMGHLNPKP